MITTKKKMNEVTAIAVLALAGAAVAFAGGCRGDRTSAKPRQFLPDMDDSPKFKAQSKTAFFTDNKAMRPTVEGTVAFGMLQDVGVVTSEKSGATDKLSTGGVLPARNRFLREDDAYFRGLNADGSFLERIPASVVIDRAALERGQERFNVVCSACHGYDGLGKGTVGVQWSYPLPNFHDPKYWDAKVDAKLSRDGYIFHVIRNGVVGPDGANKMPGYAYNVTPADAWKIVAYFRALQATRLGNLNELPEAERQRLQQLKTPGTPAAPVAPASPAGTKAPAVDTTKKEGSK